MIGSTSRFGRPTHLSNRLFIPRAGDIPITGTLITSLLDRAPFPQDSGPIDYRDYRVFAEALFFLYTHH